MLLSEIIEQVMLESGQFIVGDISNIFIDNNKFWLIVKRALAIYDKYKPVPRQMIITTTDSNYTFPTQSAPEYISRAYPSGFSYVNPFTIMSFQSGGEWPQIVYRYTKPTLYSSFSGQFEIMGHYNRTVTMTYSNSPTNTIIQDVNISDLDQTDIYFFDLVEALFMITLGKSRTAFTLPDMPVIMDAPAMLAEGQQKYQDALQNIQDSARNYYAVGG